MRIDDLLHKYFEGETTREEERELKHLFQQGNIPEEYKIYTPMFAFYQEETATLATSRQEATHTDHTPSRQSARRRRYLLYSLSGIAAGLLIILSITGINQQMNQPQNYVIIDGQRSADITLARQQAHAAFNEVSFSREDIFDSLFNE